MYLRGVFHNHSNINKIEFVDDGVKLWFKGEESPTMYYNLTSTDRIIINQILNNDINTSN